MNRHLTHAITAGAAVAAVAVTWSWAQSAPNPGARTIPYQGYLETNGAAASPATQPAMTFTLTYGASTWTECYASVPVSAGRFSVELGSYPGDCASCAATSCSDGSGVPAWAFQASDLRLSIAVNNTALGDQRIQAVPYAVRADNGAPTGSIMPFAGASTQVPAGWLLCDGKGYDGADPAYAALAAVLGGAWGGGGGSCTGTCTFNVPDLRGQFLRGAALDLGASADPDINSRVPLGNGATTAPGSTQAAGLKSHTHPTDGLRWFDPWRNNGYVAGTGNHVSAASPEAYGYATASAQSGGVAETRPRNTSVNYIIKL